MANNTNYKPNEGKREEFRRYLEKTGVMDALTKVLVLLYEEADKPEDALKFILNALARQTGSETIDDLKAQIAELQEHAGQQQEADAHGMSEATAVTQPTEVASAGETPPPPLEGAEEAQEPEKPASAEVVEESAA